VTDLETVVQRNDPDEILRAIDGLSSQRDWQALDELRRRCESAVQSGRQLHGVAGHAAYRLALEADAQWIVPLFDLPPASFLLGPLAEVAASVRTWSEVETVLDETVDVTAIAPFAYERVARGDDLRAVERLRGATELFEMPLVRESWEPAYAPTLFRSNGAEFPRPISDVIESVAFEPDTAGQLIDDPQVIDACKRVVDVWTSSSNGTVAIAAVEGGVQQAVAGLTELSELTAGPARLDRITLSSAVAAMAWAGASGGAHGRRPGLATGRLQAWWALAAFAGIDADEWPLEPEELGLAGSGLEWWTWHPRDVEDTWSWRLVAVDQREGIALAVEAVDSE
jgi:hypothetical protein